MRARLIQLDSRGRSASFPLDREQTLIGRDRASAEIVLDQYTRVSRRHAVVRALGSGHQLEDLGSANGTRVNGAPVERPVLLQPGDEIELGGEATLVYERRRSVFVPLAAALLLAAAAGGTLWWLTRTPASEPRAEIPAEAVRLAGEGLAASRTGNARTAKARLRSAAGILYREGSLDDVSRGDVMRVAMQRLGAQLPDGPDLWSVFQTSLEQAKPRPPARSPEQKEDCRLDRVSAAGIDACVRERIELVLLELRQDPTDVPPDLHRQVARRMRREHSFLRTSFKRGKPLIPMLRSELEAARMPPLLHYLACIESGYNPNARSPAKAVGLWQFIPGTAKRYKLKVTGKRDDRRDPVKSTKAAALYLNDLAFEFGGDALLLALASYNRGENGVRRALKQLEDPFSERSYWRLVDQGLLPEETALYVTRFIAAAVAGEAGLPSRERLVEAGY